MIESQAPWKHADEKPAVPGYSRHMKWRCVDIGTVWGAFSEKEFTSMLEAGWLDEESKWQHLKTGEVFVVVGPQEWCQRLEKWDESS